MKVAAIIPARYASTRFPGKPLIDINGKMMIERVYRQVEKSDCFTETLVATDDERIEEAVLSFGGNCIMTAGHHRSGTERLWEVMQKTPFDAAVNIQGDEPFIPPQLIRAIVDSLKRGSTQVVTACFHNDRYEDYLSRNVVKVVLNQQNRALYFSRSAIPHQTKEGFVGFFQHIGIYGYLRSALENYMQAGVSQLESTETLEQLRFLDLGIAIRVIPSEYQTFAIDTPGDLKRISAKSGGTDE